MFTAEASLIQRIERMIADTPIIDPHSQLKADQPGAPYLSTLMSNHALQTQLRSVGMPAKDSDPSLPDDELVRRAIPYLALMRNTTISWCFYRILRDLYDLYDPNLTESNYRDILDRVETSGRDPAWPSYVLKDRCKLRTIVTSLGNQSTEPAKNPLNLLFKLDVSDLFCTVGPVDRKPSFEWGTRTSEYYDSLSRLLGERPTTTDRFAQLLRDWLDRTLTGPVRFSHVFVPIDHRLLPAEEPSTQFILNRIEKGRDISNEDINTLARFVSHEVLGWHSDHEKAFQITVGTERPITPQPTSRCFQQNWTSEMAGAFQRFPGVRFDLNMASSVLADEAGLLARQLPNVYLSACSGDCFSPGAVEAISSHRLQTVPMTKFVGFASNARHAEWIYGRLQLVKKALAASLARLVETGFSEEDEVPSILRQILHDTPRDLYELDPVT